MCFLLFIFQKEKIFCLILKTDIFNFKNTLCGQNETECDCGCIERTKTCECGCDSTTEKKMEMLKNSNLLITQKPVQQKLDQPTKRDWNKRSKCYSCNCKKDEKGKMIKTLECKINSRKKLPMVLTDFSISFVVAYLCYFDCSF